MAKNAMQNTRMHTKTMVENKHLTGQKSKFHEKVGFFKKPLDKPH